MMSSSLNKKTLCVITGASRGIGKEIALKAAKLFAPKSALVLTARSDTALQKTTEEIHQINSSILVKPLIFDLANLEVNGMDKHFGNAIGEFVAENEPFEAAIIFHNAGTLGNNSKKASEFENATEIRDYLDVNVVSFILLNNIFLKITEGFPTRTVVNITSLLAVQGVPTYAIYGTGKAAREGFLKVLAVEDKSVKVLSYSPGPVLTDMQKEVQAKAWDSAVRDFSTNAEREGTLVTCEDTVNKLFQILDSYAFESGIHLDYYDM